MTLQSQIDRCRAEQARCKAEMDSGNPDQSGCMAGIEDWLYEEVVLLKELRLGLQIEKKQMEMK